MMKKYLSTLLMLLAFLTMTAQQEQGYLVVSAKDGQTYTFKDSDIEKISFRTQPSAAIDRMLYVIGFDVASGTWGFSVPTERIPMYTQSVEQGLLTYTGYFAGQGFKLVGEDWSENWGGSFYGPFYQNGEDIFTPQSGYYTVWFNLHQNQMWIEEAHVSVDSYSSIGLIGSFNDWANDVAMTRVPGTNSHDWYCQLAFTNDSEVKFRANGDWSDNWGGGDFPSGPGVSNGNNIQVKAGSYTVLFNDLTGHYHFYDPQNTTPLRYQPETFDNVMTLTPGQTSIAFETYSEPTVQLITAIDLPLVVDYSVSYSVIARYGGRSYHLPVNWNDANSPSSGRVATADLMNTVQNLCGKAPVERDIEIEVTASVTVNGFPEIYTASTVITCLLPPTSQSEFIYFIGATDGWANAEQRLRSVNGNGIYTGFLYMADPDGWGNQFKFQQKAGDWNSQLNYNDFISVGGDLSHPDNDSDNIAATAGEGVYFVTLDLNNMALTGTRIKNMNLVGGYNGWDAADDTQQMTWDAENYCFVMNNAQVTGDNYGWKFAANNSWDINLGGNTIEDLEADGTNLTVSGTTVRLYPTRRDSEQIYCTVE